MGKIYEATANVHIPELKCSYQKGTRFVVNENSFEVNEQKAEISGDFMLLVRHGLLKELSEEESKRPEQIAEQKIRKSAERKKMPVTMDTSTSTELPKKVTKDPGIPFKGTEISESATDKSSQAGENTVRGMQVINVDATPIENRTAKKEISKEKQAEIDAVKSARIKKANENIKENEKILSEAQKNALAKAQAAAKASREAKKKQSQEKK